MSAVVDSECIYSWWCPECDEGDDNFDREAAAELSAKDHNDEHHGPTQ